MPNFTARAIKEAFLKLLGERPLNKITVKDIVEECGINRNSFYNHFADMTALIVEIVREQVDGLIRSHPTIESIEQCFDAVIELVTSHKSACLHIYNSVNRNIFEIYLMKACLYIVTTYIETAFAGQPIREPDKAIIIRYYKCVLFGAVVDWLSEGLKGDVDAYVHRICELKKGFAEEMVRRCSES